MYRNDEVSILLQQVYANNAHTCCYIMLQIRQFVFADIIIIKTHAYCDKADSRL